MGENTSIEWADHTFNPFIGCQKVSPGCDFCYAEDMMDKRYKRVQWGPHGERVRTSEALWRKPYSWAKHAGHFEDLHGRRQRVFCASLADVFDNKVPEEWHADLWKVIADTPHLDWLLLTKRPQNIKAMLPSDAICQSSGMLWPWPHVWLGTSTEDQKRADERIPHLLATPAAVRFISAEPLLGALDLRRYLAPRCECHDLEQPHLDWVIVGGESGPNARPMHPDWARSLRDQCAAVGVAHFHKQNGEWANAEASVGEMTDSPEWRRVILHDDRIFTFEDGTSVARVGKKAAGRLLDGREHNQMPEGHSHASN